MSNPIANEASIHRFEQAWDQETPELLDFLPIEASPEYLGTLLELVIIDLEFRWKQYAGNVDSTLFPTVEGYVKRFPKLDTNQLKQQLVEEEFTIRRKYGDDPPVKPFIERFPDFTATIRNLDTKFPRGTARRRSTTSHAAPIIQHHTLIREIGEGGMGSVYLAQQNEPVRRQVAIKVIRRGLNSKDFVARFEAERQALAMMDHQNIARVYDAGVTEQGQPFFAMEFVDGIPITDFCRQNQLNIPDRLKIFNEVCAAVQHAHQKGILHRDLKPSNVLVSQSNDEVVVKVIDFGLAKAIDSEQLLTDKSLYTQAGQVLGTLMYMSPEQAVTSEKNVDTRADVYALGVILYELLTGDTPLGEESLREQGVLTVLELIRDHEPVRPSAKLNINEQTSQSISAERCTSSTALRQLLRGDLDWVVMKALEKDRERRYDSATSLADDIRRFLNDEPVVARPPSASYRLQKFARKNRIAVMSGLAMLVLLVAGITATSWQAIRATNAEQAAEEQTQIAVAKARESERRRIEADVLRKQEAEARMDAELSAERTAKILNFVVNSYHDADPLKGGKKDMLARDVLVQALDNVSQQVEGDPLSQAALYAALASSLYGLGDYDSARQASQFALQFYVDTLGHEHEKTTRANLLHAHICLRQNDGYRAREYFNASLEVQRGALFGDKPISLEELLTKSPLAIETLIGSSQALLAPPDPQPDVAVRRAQKSLSAAETLLGNEHEITLEAKLTLAAGSQRIGRTEAAVQRYREVLAARVATLGKDAPESIQVMLQLGSALTSIDRVDQALEVTTEAVQLYEQSLGNRHPRTLDAEFQLGELLIQTNDLDSAKEMFDSIRLRLDPSYLAFHRAQRSLARIFVMKHEVQDALELFRHDYIEIAWIHQVTAKPELAAIAYEKQLEQETSQREKFRILQRIVALRIWAGELQLAESGQQRRRALPPEVKPFNSELAEDISDGILSVELLMTQEKFTEAKTELADLLAMTSLITPSRLGTGLGVPGAVAKRGYSVTGSNRAWCESVLALCHAELGTKDYDAEKMSVSAYEKLRASMSSMPSFERWRVGRACEHIIRICELNQRTEEAAKWEKRLSEIENERVRVTLEDSWREYILNQQNAGGLGSVG